jgi:alkanesulfonate monooxygenase SsuD/methylene tetrahydromethanopterin reductase-like flavin-dependent oxidoreductase (luciferase family)
MPTTVARHGVYLPTFGPLADPAALVDLAVRAEEAGWDGVFLWEHVLGDGPIAVADPWVALGAMASATSRVLLGTLVSPLARRRPWVLARQAGTVSRLSGGRCVLGVGIGGDDYGDFSAFGESASVRDRAELADESLAVLDAVWAGRAYTAAGRYRIDLPAGVPEPHRIPVWVAGTLPHVRSAHRAARRDGLVLLGWDATPDQVADARNRLRAHGLPDDRPFDVILAGNASAAWPEAPAVDLAGFAEAGVTWWMESLVHHDPLALTLRVVDAGPEAVTAASRPR